MRQGRDLRKWFTLTTTQSSDKRQDFKSDFPCNPYRERSLLCFRVVFGLTRSTTDWGCSNSWKTKIYKVFLFSDVIGNKRTIGQNNPMRFSTLVFFTLRKERDSSSKPIVSCKLALSLSLLQPWKFRERERKKKSIGQRSLLLCLFFFFYSFFTFLSVSLVLFFQSSK